MKQKTNKGMRIIKKYKNGKLYDIKKHCYLNLTDIGNMIRGDEEIRVIDNSRKIDVTSETYIQVMLEAEKKTDHKTPLSVLEGIIKGN